MNKNEINEIKNTYYVASLEAVIRNSVYLLPLSVGSGEAFENFRKQMLEQVEQAKARAEAYANEMSNR
jgi:hypothetical protein